MKKTRAAAGDPHSRSPEFKERGTGTGKKQHGVQSVEIGLRIAFELARSEGPIALRELAEKCGLPASKTHRYLVSLVRAGVVDQNERNGRYDLGQGALVLGLAAMGRLDEQRFASDALSDLHEVTGQTAAALVWGTYGATIVLRKESMRPTTVNTRIGSVLSTVSSASGRVFAAFLPRDIVEPLVAAEFAKGIKPTYLGRLLDIDGFWNLIERTKRAGLARVRGDLLSGVDAVSAPVFNHEGRIIMVLSVWGGHGALDIAPQGKVDQLLEDAAAKLSARLGFPGPNVLD